MLARTMTAAIACLFLLSVGSTAFSQSNDSSKESKSESSSENEEQDDDKEDSDEDEEAKTEAQRRKDMAKKVRKKSIVKTIGATGEGGSMNDGFSEGYDETSMEDAFHGAKGIKTADEGASEDSDKSGPRAVEVARCGGKTKRCDDEGEAFRVSVDEPELGGDGTLDAKWVTRVTRRRASAVNRCLERSFKKSESSAGNFSIEMTIGARGRVTEVAVADSDFDDAAGTCIQRTAKRWRFPRPEGGSVTAKTVWTVSIEGED